MEHTSTQQRQVIDLAVKTKLLLDSIDAWLVKQPSLVNHRKRALLPVAKPALSYLVNTQWDPHQ